MQLIFKTDLKDLDKSEILITTLTKDGLKKITSKSSTKTESLLSKLNKSYAGRISSRLSNSDFEGNFGQTVSFDIIDVSKKPLRLVIIGWNSESKNEFENVNQYRQLGALVQSLSKRAQVTTPTLAAEDLDWSKDLNQEAFIEGALLSGYTYTKYKSTKDKKIPSIQKVLIHTKKFSKNSNHQLINSFCTATFLARDLVNLAPNDCPPAELVKTAKQIARNQRLEIKVFNRAALKKMGAGGILGVSMASAFEPYLIKLSYKSKNKNAKKVALVGKGVTFDSGGLSIKTGVGMETMKCDMSGAAAVLGAMSMIRDLAPNYNVTAYIPTVENMIAANALRPGDIIKHMNGKTSEILNTDAEGRLILADALTLSAKDQNDIVIDLATLTGACVVALGNDYAGIFSNNKELSDELILAAENEGERLWPMPLAPEYASSLKSTVADLKNIGSRSGGGAITAALYLENFIDKSKKWAHLDIAGPAFREGDSDLSKSGGVGFGVRTLLRFLSK